MENGCFGQGFGVPEKVNGLLIAGQGVRCFAVVLGYKFVVVLAFKEAGFTLSGQHQAARGLERYFVFKMAAFL